MRGSNAFGRTLWQGFVIVLLAGTLGFSANHVRSTGLPLVGDWSPEARIQSDFGEELVISLEDASTFFAKGKILFLDARSPQEYQKGHIQGALNLPWQSFDQFVDKVILQIDMEAFIVTYCDGVSCTLAEHLARELSLMGYEKVQVLVNGWTAWREAGLPVQGDMKS